MPFESMHLRIEEAIEKLNPPRVRNASRSAFANLRGSWKLHPIDAEMSLFRAITAEEEAATALIRALNEQKYPNAERLKERRHDHKSAIWPLILAVNQMMLDKNIPVPSLALSLSGQPRIELSIDIAGQSNLSKPLWGTPDEPFNFVLRSDKHGPFQVHDFEAEFDAIAKNKGSNSIKQHVERQANIRNEVLYASEKGIPGAVFQDSLILDKRSRVMAILTLTISVMQTPKHQFFIVQCLEALLKAIQGFESAVYDYPSMEVQAVGMSMIQQPDGSMKATIIGPSISGYSYRYTIMPDQPK